MFLRRRDEVKWSPRRDGLDGDEWFAHLRRVGACYHHSV